MFFNISNHPAHAERTTWSPEQIEAANKLGGEIVDVTFPAVTPDMSNRELEKVAHDLAEQIWRQSKSDEKSAAMVAGHYVMTVLVVRYLQDYGITCYIGDSIRVAEEQVQADGTIAIIHRFQFAGFREYPDLVYSLYGNI